MEDQGGVAAGDLSGRHLGAQRRISTPAGCKAKIYYSGTTRGGREEMWRANKHAAERERERDTCGY